MRIIALGCSITNGCGWTDHVRASLSLTDQTQYDCHNLSRGSGSNQIQIKRFQEFLLDHVIEPEDIIMWQITSTTRAHARYPALPRFVAMALQDSQGHEHLTYNIYTRHANLFDLLHRLDFLSHSQYAQKIWIDEAQVLEDLLFMLQVARKYTKNVLVFRGWQTVIHENCLTKFTDELARRDITYLPEALVDWCTEQRLPFKDDNFHPRLSTSQIFSREIILPALRKILGRNVQSAQIVDDTKLLT